MKKDSHAVHLSCRGKAQGGFNFLETGSIYIKGFQAGRPDMGDLPEIRYRQLDNTMPPGRVVDFSIRKMAGIIQEGGIVGTVNEKTLAIQGLQSFLVSGEASGPESDGLFTAIFAEKPDSLCQHSFLFLPIIGAHPVRKPQLLGPFQKKIPVIGMKMKLHIMPIPNDLTAYLLTLLPAKKVMIEYFDEESEGQAESIGDFHQQGYSPGPALESTHNALFIADRLQILIPEGASYAVLGIDR